MRKMGSSARIVMACVVVALIGSPSNAGTGAARQSEGCLAHNPGHPTCTWRFAQAPTTEVTGWSGVGEWELAIHRGKRIIRITSEEHGPVRLWRFRPGDRVHATALTPGSYVLVGHISP